MNTPRLYGDLSWVWPLLSPAEDYPEEAAVIRSHFVQAGVPDGARLLHLGCGGGSLDHHLKQHFKVTGLDCSAAMLARAAEVNPEVEYIVGDMRDAALGRTFDAVLLHDAQSYLTKAEEFADVYATAARHLKAGGVFVSAPEALREHFVQDRVTSSTSQAQGGAHVTTIELHHDADPTDHVFETTYMFVIRREGHQRVEVDVHQKGLWDLDEIVAPMAEAGFVATVSRPEVSSAPPRVLITAVKP
ncbi:MAG: class I SAM-dependent methyltransferase [Nannocystaceae bacterium]|nr:class I SAM-dependent methyltransferase [Nannocystaceae bacterium]